MPNFIKNALAEAKEAFEEIKDSALGFLGKNGFIFLATLLIIAVLNFFGNMYHDTLNGPKYIPALVLAAIVFTLHPLATITFIVEIFTEIFKVKKNK